MFFKIIISFILEIMVWGSLINKQHLVKVLYFANGMLWKVFVKRSIRLYIFSFLENFIQNSTYLFKNKIECAIANVDEILLFVLLKKCMRTYFYYRYNVDSILYYQEIIRIVKLVNDIICTLTNKWVTVFKRSNKFFLIFLIDNIVRDRNK